MSLLPITDRTTVCIVDCGEGICSCKPAGIITTAQTDIMTKKDKKITVDIPIYTGTLTTVLVGDWDELKGMYPAMDTEYLSSCYAAVVFTDEHTEDDGAHYVAAFCGRPEGKTIAHETVHVVNRVFSDRGARLDPFNDEPQAYLTGWVYGEIEGALKKL